MDVTASRPTSSRLRTILATGLVLAAGAAGSAQAHSSGHVVSLGSGRSAIQSFAVRVKGLTGASGYSLKNCARSGSTDVACHVEWSYALGLSCGVKADAYYSGSAVKVRRASGINCTSNFTT